MEKKERDPDYITQRRGCSLTPASYPVDMQTKRAVFSALAAAATSIIFVAAKVWLLRQNFLSRFVATKRLSGQNYVCHKKKRGGGTKSLLRQIFPARNTCLLRQKFCRDKHVVVATKVSMSPQNFCRNKIMLVATNICRDKRFFTKENKCLSRQTFCRDKHTVVATKDVCCSSRQ